MASDEFLVIDRIEPCRVACHATAYPADDFAERIDIGPLFPLFFESARRTAEKETGRRHDDGQIRGWLGLARFHLPPTLRWLYEVRVVAGQLCREGIEVRMACSDRVIIGDHPLVRSWPGGVYASVESRFDIPLARTWDRLQGLIKRNDLIFAGSTLLVENLQAANHGGWDRYRLLAELDVATLRARRIAV